MRPEDSIGRIQKAAFIISTSFFFGLAVLGVALRCLIRFWVRKDRFAADDALLLVGLAFLIAAMATMYQEVIDRMYLSYALLLGIEGVIPPADWRDMSSRFHLWSSISLTLVWLAFCAVKLSFLLFFRTLISRLRPWLIYWWVITMFNAVVLIYGTTIYFASCPYYFDERELQCSTGDRKRTIVIPSILLMVSDTIGDVLILVIPFSILWKIRIRLSQKIILGCSLCLTIVMIALSIVRVCGLVYGDSVDSIWQTYWQFLGSEIGVFLASAVAFRSFFTARKQSSNDAPYSIKRAWKKSVSKTIRRSQSDRLHNSWDQMPESELESLQPCQLSSHQGSCAGAKR
ncbi:hypothetical protein BJX70DRAFT_405376 [Aspergillus crustosus]